MLRHMSDCTFHSSTWAHLTTPHQLYLQVLALFPCWNTLSVPITFQALGVLPPKTQVAIGGYGAIPMIVSYCVPAIHHCTWGIVGEKKPQNNLEESPPWPVNLCQETCLGSPSFSALRAHLDKPYSLWLQTPALPLCQDTLPIPSFLQHAKNLRLSSPEQDPCNSEEQLHFMVEGPCALSFHLGLLMRTQVGHCQSVLQYLTSETLGSTWSKHRWYHMQQYHTTLGRKLSSPSMITPVAQRAKMELSTLEESALYINYLCLNASVQSNCAYSMGKVISHWDTCITSLGLHGRH